jgi:GGDEF domain-containing protein
MLLTSIRRRIADAIAPELMEQRNALERAANYDALTGLANRRAFDLAIAAAELDPQTSIILFDANNFGKLNKAAGHKFGDVILREMATTIRQQTGLLLGTAERVFRYGGDEFVVICPASIANTLRDNCEAKFGFRYWFDVSLVGTVGGTLAEADATLQDRKAGRKAGR